MPVCIIGAYPICLGTVYSGLAFWQQLGTVRLSPVRDWEGVLFFELTVCGASEPLQLSPSTLKPNHHKRDMTTLLNCEVQGEFEFGGNGCVACLNDFYVGAHTS